MDIMISKFGLMNARIRMLHEEIKHEIKNLKEQLKINSRTCIEIEISRDNLGK